MPRRISITSLNATTNEILNTIRANASSEYQSLVPKVDSEKDIPAVGEVLYGYPALANQFISSLVNRIATVRVNSATFNNAYADLKKGFLEFGETVEEVFVGLTRVREFSAEKAEAREFKRTLPDVKTAFHAMNWRVQYPVTITQQELKTAFVSYNGVQDLIAKIVGQITTSSEYDEFLLFKYLLIKAVTGGKMHYKEIDLSKKFSDAAIVFRSTSDSLLFMSKDYNNAGVTTTTPKNDQYIFMDTKFHAQYDVDILANAFHMDKTTFEGHLKLIDNWTTFDNERFAEIRQNSDMIDEVTAPELEAMSHVKAILVDKEWFQVYDNLAQMEEAKVASGMYWNYFYHVWKTVSSSPFSNAIVFMDNIEPIVLPSTVNYKVESKVTNDNGTIGVTFVPSDAPKIPYNFVQNEECTTHGAAVHPYGAIICSEATPVHLTIEAVGAPADYLPLTTSVPFDPTTAKVGDTVAFTNA